MTVLQRYAARHLDGLRGSDLRPHVSDLRPHVSEYAVQFKNAPDVIRFSD